MNQEQRFLINTDDVFKKIIITWDAVALLYNDDGVSVMRVNIFLLNSNNIDI